jgi:ribonuclease BN (tRNA processing enzyme)
MKITFLGTGVIVPTKKRAFPGLLVEIGNEKLLFDCGPCTIHRLIKLGVDISLLKHVFITHFHIDHVLDYIALVKIRALTGREELNVYGPKGLEKFNKDVFENILAFSYMSKDLKCFEFLKVKEAMEGIVEKTKNWVVTCTPVLHFNGVAYRIDSHGKSVVYSGDSASDENIIKLSKNADLLIHECSYPDEKSLLGLHTIPSKLADIARKSNVKKLVLNHLYPECDGREKEMVKEIKEKFDGEVMVAEDMMEIDL